MPHILHRTTFSPTGVINSNIENLCFLLKSFSEARSTMFCGRILDFSSLCKVQDFRMNYTIWGNSKKRRLARRLSVI